MGGWPLALDQASVSVRPNEDWARLSSVAMSIY